MVLGFGPYIGDFQFELTVFRPYIRWVNRAVEAYESVFISSHYNRDFLYWVDDSHFIPVDTDYSLNEEIQVGSNSNNIKLKDYFQLVKNFKEKIVDCGYDKKKVKLYYTYAKSTQYPLHNRIFERINNLEKIDYCEDKILFILDNNKTALELYRRIGFKNEAIILEDIQILNSDKYRKILSCIESSKIIICPIGFWTFVCNLQNKPVISWGVDNIGLYRSGGAFNLDNEKILVCCSNNVNIIEKFISANIYKE